MFSKKKNTGNVNINIKNIDFPLQIHNIKIVSIKSYSDSWFVKWFYLLKSKQIFWYKNTLVTYANK